MEKRKAPPEQIIYDDARIQARESNQYLILRYKQPHSIHIPKPDQAWQELEMVRLNRLRTLSGNK